MVCWWRNTKALHLIKQRGALQAKSGSCASRTSSFQLARWQAARISLRTLSSRVGFENLEAQAAR
jgi:hypothetical protein